MSMEVNDVTIYRLKMAAHLQGKDLDRLRECEVFPVAVHLSSSGSASNPSPKTEHEPFEIDMITLSD